MVPVKLILLFYFLLAVVLWEDLLFGRGGHFVISDTYPPAYIDCDLGFGCVQQSPYNILRRIVVDLRVYKIVSTYLYHTPHDGVLASPDLTDIVSAIKHSFKPGEWWY